MKKGTKGIIKGAVLLLLGMVIRNLFLLLFMIVHTTSEQQGDESQFIVPGVHHVQIEKPGRYYLWYDYSTSLKEKRYKTPWSIPEDVTILIRNNKGEKLDFHKPGNAMEICVRNHKKRSVGFVNIKNPGTIDITITGHMDERVFSFSKFMIFNRVTPTTVGSLCSGLLYLSGLGFIIWGFVKLHSQS